MKNSTKIFALVSLIALSSFNLFATEERNAKAIVAKLTAATEGKYAVLAPEAEAQFEKEAFFSTRSNQELLAANGIDIRRTCLISMGTSSTQVYYLDRRAAGGELISQAFPLGLSHLTKVQDISLGHLMAKVAPFLAYIQSLEGKGLHFVLCNSIGYTLAKGQGIFHHLHTMTPPAMRAILSPSHKKVDEACVPEVNGRISILFEALVVSAKGRPVSLKNRACKPKIENPWIMGVAKTCAEDYIVDLGGGSATLYKIIRDDVTQDPKGYEMCPTKFPESANDLLAIADPEEALAAITAFSDQLMAFVAEHSEGSSSVRVVQTGNIRTCL